MVIEITIRQSLPAENSLCMGNQHMLLLLFVEWYTLLSKFHDFMDLNIFLSLMIKSEWMIYSFSTCNSFFVREMLPCVK